MAASSSKYSFLMEGTTSGSATTWEKLVDIIDYPDLESPPDDIDTTTLSDYAEQSIPGIITGSAYDFSCLYDPTEYAALKAKEGSELDLALWFGATKSGSTVTPTGDLGKFEFSGYITVILTGGGVNEARKMTVHVNRTSDIAFSSGT